MSSEDLNRLLNETGVSTTWQSALTKVALAVVKAVAPQVLALLEKLVTTGSLALIKRLNAAFVPAAAPDVALDIVRGIEKDHGDDAPLTDRWTSTFRAEMAAAAIRAWMVTQGGKPDTALVNQVLEEAVARLRIEQDEINRKLAQEPEKIGDVSK